MGRLNGKILFFLALSAFFLPQLAKAVNTGTVGILPANPDPDVRFSDAWFMYNLDLGQRKNDSVRVLNNKDETVVVKLYASDATTTIDGSFTLLSEEVTNKNLGNWVELAVEEVEIPPKSEKIIPFTINIPKNADVGDHMGGIVMREMEIDENANMAGMGVRIITCVGVRIYETVPGEVKKDFEVTRFDWRLEPSGKASWIKNFLDINKKTIFFTGIKNEGNVRISPKITIDIKNIFGQTVAHLPDQEAGVIFPGEEVKEAAVTWSGMPIFGRYKVLMTANFFEDGVGQGSREVVIWAIPYRIIFLLVILAVFLILLRLTKIYFQEASKEKMPIYPVKLGDNLADVAKKFSVSWKKIAKMNFIGKPFEIRAGEKLFIPVTRKNKKIISEMKAQRMLEPSISERAGIAGFKRKRIFFIGLVLILIGSGAVWALKARQGKMIHEEIKAPEAVEEPKEETADKTKSGVFKKSSVNVAIATPSGADQKSSDKLFKKFELIGYRVRLAGMPADMNYKTITIEYKTGKQEQAEMVKKDLGIEGDIELKEMPNLESDAVIYNFAPADAFFDLNGT
jgi:LysM repeat protein